MADAKPELQFDTLVSLSKRRGFVFPGSEIYGGIGGFWDYGPLGVEMKNNIKRAWWRAMVQERDDVVGIDAAIVMNPRVWEASGHVATFTDPMVDCKNCKHRFRADHLVGDVCPDCGAKGEFTEARPFNLMFKTFVGPVEDTANEVYLRPETAQAMFVNFENVVTSMRRKLPLGIAQIGRSFRNEITPGNFIFRDREFEQMEMEFFVKPGTDDHWHQHWGEQRLNWFKNLGVREENLRIRHHEQSELSHYSKATFDIEYQYAGLGWSELEGIANRTDFDLKQHAQFSGKSLSYFDEESGEHIVPYVIEPAVGVDRTFLVMLYDAYREEEVAGEKRVVLKLHPQVAPIKVAVLPLSRNEKLAPLSKEIASSLRKHFMIQLDDTQSIGRRYRRQDEIGTPFCVTIDFESLEDNAVTIRDRDTMEQTRVAIPELVDVLRDRLALP
ncbi:MAG: glycine--tRNA ligase [Dehalococcoidia bacterium]